MEVLVLAIIVLIVLIVMLVAWLMAIDLFVNAAKEKGYYKDGGAGLLWFIGIFATPIVVGLYTSSLPDKRSRDAISSSASIASESIIQDELPSL